MHFAGPFFEYLQSIFIEFNVKAVSFKKHGVCVLTYFVPKACDAFLCVDTPILSDILLDVRKIKSWECGTQHRFEKYHTGVEFLDNSKKGQIHGEFLGPFKIFSRYTPAPRAGGGQRAPDVEITDGRRHVRPHAPNHVLSQTVLPGETGTERILGLNSLEVVG